MEGFQRTHLRLRVVARWPEPYDSAKDVAVFVRGIALTKDIEQKVRLLNEHYNVLVVEPTREHDRDVFAGDGIEEVAALFDALVDSYLPADAQVRVTAGVGRGGKIAYLLACRFGAERGQLPAVVAGDAVATEALPQYAGRVVLLQSPGFQPGPAGEYAAWHPLANILSVLRDATLSTWRTVERAIWLWDRMTQGKEEMEAVWRDEVVAVFRPRTEKILSSIELLEGDGAEAGAWREAAGGTGLFHRLDASAVDCKKLFVPVWPIEPQRFVWWLGLFAGDYFFRPEESPPAAYATRDDGTALEISTDGTANTWVYLPSKETYPTTYALEFDYTVHQPLKETLQLCFCFDSLAERLRFVLNDNASLGFEVVKSGMFPSVRDKALWASCRRPCAIPLGRPVRVRLEVDGDAFRLGFDGTQAMAARFNGFVPHPSRWAIIAWNGFGTGAMKVKIGNLKVYVRDEK